ncbi:MAG: dihydroorotase [Candidatus Competibacteraceae bacterium]|nr:dihydroorotase [Candidatus Competibacteraceae bacterium]
MDTVIRNGRLVDPANGLDTHRDLYIQGTRVVGVGEAPAGFQPARIIEASGRVVCPGLVDLCARLQEPGLEQKADIASETRAAARGGITTLVCPPDTDPVVDETAVVEQIRRRARAAGRAWVLPLGALTRGLAGEQLAEMAALRDGGCVAISDGGRPIKNTLVLRRALEYAASFDLTVFLTPLDPWLGSKGGAHDGQVAARLGLSGIPVAAETAALGRLLALVEEVGVKAHFGRLSSARAVAMVAEARGRGLNITADVAAHQLFLTEMDLGHSDGLTHLLPPLRSQRDRDALRQGLAEGTLGALCSDHQPHEPDAKLNPFPDTEPGMSALETLLPLGLRLVEEGIMDLATLIQRLTLGPARVLDWQGGRLGVGDRADICIFDPATLWTLEPGEMVSRGRNTPLKGWELQGRVTHTLLAGRVVFEAESP